MKLFILSVTNIFTQSLPFIFTPTVVFSLRSWFNVLTFAVTQIKITEILNNSNTHDEEQKIFQ